MRRARFAMVILIAAALSGACTQGAERSRTTTNDEGQGPTAMLLALLNPPPVLSQAEQIVTARCMRREGFRYPLPAARPDFDTPTTLAGQPLAIETARLEGYGFSQMRDDDVQKFLSRLGPKRRARAREALEPARGSTVSVTFAGSYEVSAGRHGCVAEGRIATYGSVRKFLVVWYGPQVIQTQIQTYIEEAVRAREVVEGTALYSACMQAAGFPAASPRDAWQAARDRFARASGNVSVAQRRMAMADAECQARSQIYQRTSRALAKVGRDVIRRSSARLQMMMDIERSSVPRAEAIVAADPAGVGDP